MPVAGKFRYLFLAVDHFSKFAVAEPAPNARTPALLAFLRRVFTQLGPFNRLLSDPGPQFRALALRRFLQRNHVHHDQSGRRHFEGNGCLERLVHTLTQTAAKMGATHDTWPAKLGQVLQAYNKRPHTSTGAEPLAVFFKAPVRLQLDQVHRTSGPPAPSDTQVALHRDNVTSSWQRAAKQRRIQPFHQGDAVLHCPRPPTTLRHARDRRFLPRRHGPYFIIERYPRNRYLATDGYRQYLLPGWELQHYSQYRASSKKKGGRVRGDL